MYVCVVCIYMCVVCVCSHMCVYMCVVCVHVCICVVYVFACTHVYAHACTCMFPFIFNLYCACSVDLNTYRLHVLWHKEWQHVFNCGFRMWLRQSMQLQYSCT